jgi:Holliday junction DNA helicase RuvA
MISTLNGVVKSLSPDRAIIEVGGVGMSVLINSHTSSSLSLGAPAHLFTSLVVREDSLTLYGFSDEASRVLFELVQTVSGIGPKVALSILGALTPSELAQAVTTENISVIEKVPGIGKKGAQRLVLEQLASALISLGFSAKDSDEAINSVLSTLSQEEVASMALGDLLKLALQSGKK